MTFQSCVAKDHWWAYSSCQCARHLRITPRRNSITREQLPSPRDPNKEFSSPSARRGGAAVAGWTLDRKIRVRFPAYPQRVWALWWQGGKRRLRTSRCPCRARLSTLKTPNCPWRGCPAAGQNLETWHLSRHFIAEISLNVTLNHKQH